jgi:hypothetical protein
MPCGSKDRRSKQGSGHGLSAPQRAGPDRSFKWFCPLRRTARANV